MAYGDTFLIETIDDGVEMIYSKTLLPKDYITDILKMIWGIGYREGKQAEKKRMIELLKLE